jgi:translation initiation factor IF-1
MPTQAAIITEGKIVSVLPGTMLRVEVANRHLVLAHLSGKMRKRFIRLTIGDRVKLEMSPYDLKGQSRRCDKTVDLRRSTNASCCGEIPGGSASQGVPARQHQAGRHAGRARSWSTTGFQGEPATGDLLRSVWRDAEKQNRILVCSSKRQNRVAIWDLLI